MTRAEVTGDDGKNRRYGDQDPRMTVRLRSQGIADEASLSERRRDGLAWIAVG